MNEKQNDKGAEWWKQMLTRREAGARIVGLAAGALLIPALGAISGCGDGEEEAVVETDALDLQKSSGWNVGAEEAQLRVVDRVATDSRQSADWSRFNRPEQLLEAWGVRDSRWQPFVVPTLVQSLSQPTLAANITPVHNTKMDEAYRRGLGMREIILAAKHPDQMTVVTDLPGPEAVAFAAAIADVADPVLTFDNWPHPEGVVAAQQTLGALLYYAGEVAAKRENRTWMRDSTASTAASSAASTITRYPAVFVLDSDRLNAPVSGSANEFDNRYIAKLPDAPAFKNAGVTNVMYAVPDAAQKTELDDLNELFAGYREAGVTVSMVPLSDFKPATAQTASDTGSTTRSHYGGVHHTPYFYGGGMMFLPLFFHSYPSYGYRGTLPPANRFGGASVSRPGYVPTRRPTVFSSRTTGGASGVGRTKPSGFGRVSRSTGGGFSSGRSSGSYGRARGGASS